MRSRVRTRPAPVDPFIKWVGGKRRLLDTLVPMLPAEFERGTYFEPFLGGGALFFHLRPARAVLADQNEKLVETYVAIRDEVDVVLDYLERLAHRHRFSSAYYDTRQRINEGRWRERAELAAMFVYLNRTCFNGIWRVNARGEMNAPEGSHPKRQDIVNARGMYAASIALQGATILHADYETAVSSARAGDFVYFDPPYVPTGDDSFVAYDESGFGSIEHRVLVDVARQLDRNGVRVMLSNSAAPLVHRLYAGDPFHVDVIRARRSVSGSVAARGDADEVVVRNYVARRRNDGEVRHGEA